MTLTRDQILAKMAELPRTSIEVPELGGSVIIRVLTLKEVGEFNKIQKASSDSHAIYPRFLAMACCNEDGSPLFVGEDVKLIDSLPWPAVDFIAQEIMYLNKMQERPKKAKKDGEDQEATDPKG